MRTLFVYILLFLSPTAINTSNSLFGEERMRPLTQQEIADFDKSLKAKSDATISLESVFIQEKNLEMLSKKMVSKGIFRFKREDKIAFLYEEPLKYQMIINGNRLKIVNNGKSQIIELKNNPLMKEMKGLIEASFLGRLSKMDASYRISYFQKDNNIVVIILPTNKSVSDMIKKITVSFDKKTLDILQLQLDEGAKSSTIYYFTDPKLNTLKSDESFNLS